MFNVSCQAQAQSVELTFLRKQKYLDTFNINSYGWCWGVTELILGAAAHSRIEIYVKLENSLNPVPNWCTSLQFSLVFWFQRHLLIIRIAGGIQFMSTELKSYALFWKFETNVSQKSKLSAYFLLLCRSKPFKIAQWGKCAAYSCTFL